VNEKNPQFVEAKILAVMVAMVMTLGLTATNVSAATPTTGSITVNPNNNGQVYTLYKLFDAEITFGADGKQQAITYKLPAGKSLDTTGEQWFEINDNGFVEAKNTLNETVMKSAAFKEWAMSIGTPNSETKTAAKDNDPNVKWEGLSFGYYFVDSTLGSYIGIDSANPNATIQDKNNPPKLDKKIKSVKDVNNADDGSIFAATDTSEIQFEGDGTNEHAIAQIGDTVTFTVDVTIKPGAEAYVLSDTMDEGLTAPAASAVTIKNGETPLGTDAVTVGVSGQTITATFAQTYLNSITTDTVVTMEYTATLNAKAIVGGVNNNKARLEWGHKDTKDYTEDESKVWTAKIGVEKHINTASGEYLSGAGFVLAKGSGENIKYYKRDAATEVVTWVSTIDDATEKLTGTNGQIEPFTGLPNGTYTLIEKTVPAGYNKTTDTTITINESDVTAENLAKTAIVINNAGSVLPSTGGIGTTIFYAIGSVLVVGAGILLISKKRMFN